MSNDAESIFGRVPRRSGRSFLVHSSFLILLSSFTLCPAAAENHPAPRLLAIHPSAHKLPANHLKFYLHFSQPMRQGVFLDHCRLLDHHNQPVAEPFRETELWNEDGTRLTLWFHPGRQKTGVNLNVDLGPIIQPRHHYTLVISGEWPSATGIPLGGDVMKPFDTTERATARLDIKSWKIIAPAAGTKEPLEVRFPAPLDHALLQRCLRVVSDDGRIVAGAARTAAAEQTWLYVPKEPWYPGAFTLEVESILEDLAGNSLARPFEVDITGPVPRKVPPVLRAAFRIEPR